eukprot:57095_1
MSLPANVQKAIWQTNLKSELHTAGYAKIRHIADTLQGSIYAAIHVTSRKDVVIKVTDKYLHKKSISRADIKHQNKHHQIEENILSEGEILKQLTKNKTAPKSIIKYIDLLECNSNYYLVMEHGGDSLFNFIVKGHQCLSQGHITLDEWHRFCKFAFKQMIECIQYIHSQKCAHLDVSLENFLINDVDVNFTQFASGKKSRIQFQLDSVQIKIIDFGLAEMYTENEFASNKYVGKRNYKCPEICSETANFSSKSNDIWCLGICLFIMMFGSSPWNKAVLKDPNFNNIMCDNGNIAQILKVWNRY